MFEHHEPSQSGFLKDFQLPGQGGTPEMTPQTPQPGPLASPPFPSLGPGRAGTWPFPSSLLTAAPGQGAATGRTNLSSIPWEPRTLRDLHGGPSQSILHHSRTRASRPRLTADLALQRWRLPAMPQGCHVPRAVSSCDTGRDRAASVLGWG